jgi:hypothetical protein
MFNFLVTLVHSIGSVVSLTLSMCSSSCQFFVEFHNFLHISWRQNFSNFYALQKSATNRSGSTKIACCKNIAYKKWEKSCGWLCLMHTCITNLVICLFDSFVPKNFFFILNCPYYIQASTNINLYCILRKIQMGAFTWVTAKEPRPVFKWIVSKLY